MSETAPALAACPAATTDSGPAAELEKGSGVAGADESTSGRPTRPSVRAALCMGAHAGDVGTRVVDANGKDMTAAATGAATATAEGDTGTDTGVGIGIGAGARSNTVRDAERWQLPSTSPWSYS